MIQNSWKKCLLSTTFLTAFFIGAKSYAIVDLKNANYADAWIDLTIPGTGYDLRVERAYNSRTLFNGMFGFGWCSDFETDLDITPEGNIRLTECGAGLETTYQSKAFSEKDIEKTVRTIMEHVHSENTTAPAAFFSDLEHRLKSETALRGEYASKYGIARPIADKTRFYAIGKEADFIEKVGNNFTRTLTDGSIEKFTLKGKLEKVFDHNGNYLTFTYDGNKLRDITDNNGRKITFALNDNGKVKSITGPNGIKTEYKFTGIDLTYVKASNGAVYTYEYDDLHNMTKVIFPDKTTKEMTYNKNEDWVTSFKDVDGCKETYDYQTSKDKPKDHFWANVQKTCDKKVVLNAKYEFWYESNSSGTVKFLKKSHTQENKVSTEVVYNENGKPIQMVRNGKTTKYEYTDDGLLKKKISADGVVTQLKYDNPFKKVSKVIHGKKSSDFAYDSKGNLIKATNSDGQRVSLSYDTKGRIAVIEDQARRKVLIKYEDRFGKPSFIEREGIGSITVTYNNKGDIEKVASAAGSSVAIQVASTFSNLLDLVQPAGVSLTF